MFGMFTIEKISSFLAGFTHIQNMTCSCQGNEITHEFVSSETFIAILISVDMHNQYEWQHMLPEAVAIVCRCFETFILKLFCSLLTSTYSATYSKVLFCVQHQVQQNWLLELDRGRPSGDW